jgi:DNA-binding Lrp family transcriptional regulator
MHLSEREVALLDGWQRGFPLVPRPYRVIGAGLGAGEEAVLAALSELSRRGVLSRVGATVRPNTAGASTLAAMRLPAARLEAVAEIVNAEPGVNHNYEREHDLNLWFVVTGADWAAVDTALARIRQQSGLDVLTLPLEKSYVIDLGFPISKTPSGAQSSPRCIQRTVPVPILRPGDRLMLGRLQDGLPLAARPYRALGRDIGLTEGEVIADLGRLIEDGIIARFGLIVRHRELGFRANAMAVWDVEDHDVDRVGELVAGKPFVTLCYRRRRCLPVWPHNLFCMVHGRERETVSARVDALNEIDGLAGRPSAVLFSRRCFRQRGASLRAA